MEFTKTLNSFYRHPTLIGSFFLHMGIEGVTSKTIQALGKAVIGGEAKKPPKPPEGLYCDHQNHRVTYGFQGLTILDQKQIASWRDAAHKAVAISGALLVSVAAAYIAKESMLFFGASELPALSDSLNKIVLDKSAGELKSLILGQLVVTALLLYCDKDSYETL